LKKPIIHKKKAGGVAQGVGPEVKPQSAKKKKEIYVGVFTILFICYMLKSLSWAVVMVSGRTRDRASNRHLI
jgi:hypothetical protein